MQVAKDTVVTIAYRAALDDGRVIDSTDACGPVTYLHGNEQIFPALEQAVEGLEPGAEREIRLAPADCYGAPREELVRRMSRTQLPPGLELTVGERYRLRGPSGQTLDFRLVAVEGDEVVADFNHRAAGQGLRIEARVLAVRAASAEELRRGTVR